MPTCITEGYCDEDGNWHWMPDQSIASELYYGFDWADWLAEEVDVLDSVTWVVPAGITNMAEAINGSKTYIKLKADSAGDYEIICNIGSSEGAATQKKQKSAIITFY